MRTDDGRWRVDEWWSLMMIDDEWWAQHRSSYGTRQGSPLSQSCKQKTTRTKSKKNKNKKKRHVVDLPCGQSRPSSERIHCDSFSCVKCACGLTHLASQPSGYAKSTWGGWWRQGGRGERESREGQRQKERERKRKRERYRERDEEIERERKREVIREREERERERLQEKSEDREGERKRKRKRKRTREREREKAILIALRRRFLNSNGSTFYSCAGQTVDWISSMQHPALPLNDDRKSVFALPAQSWTKLLHMTLKRGFGCHATMAS